MTEYFLYQSSFKCSKGDEDYEKIGKSSYKILTER
jgi:hypothetical protein